MSDHQIIFPKIGLYRVERKQDIKKRKEKKKKARENNTWNKWSDRWGKKRVEKKYCIYVCIIIF